MAWALLFHILSLIGALIILVTKYMSSHGMIAADDKRYLKAQLVACVLLFGSLIINFNAGSLLLQVVLILIYIKALLR